MKTLLCVLVLLWTAFAFAQTRVDGSEHPELIPDDAAICAVFSVHSRYGDASETENSEKTHEKIGFSDVDHSAYDQVMHEMNDTREAALRDQQNGGKAGLKPMQAKEANDKLQKSLSPEGKAKLDKFIQDEKRHMVYVVGLEPATGGER
jgi:hypothetical protein